MDNKKFLDDKGLKSLAEKIKSYDAASLTLSKGYTDEQIAANKVIVDTALSDTSTNPVQNKALKAEFQAVQSQAEAYTDQEVAKVTSGTVVVKNAEHAVSAISATTATTATNANHATTADSATSATTASSATKAIHDGNDKVIADTYQTIAKATSQHNSLQSSIDSKVNKTTTINGKQLTGNITLSAADVNAATTAYVDAAESDANKYTDNAIANLLDNDTAAVDSIMELAEAMETNADAIDALRDIAGGKADAEHNHDNRYYTESEIDTKISNINTSISGKAAKATTLSGYGITDAYTKSQVDSALSSKANTSDIPTVPTKVSAFTNDSGYLTVVPSEYVTETELSAKGYLTSVPSEYITESELSAKKYLTSIPSEYVTETELSAKGYATQSGLDSHTGNTDVHITSAERTKLAGIATGAQVNTITGVKGNSESTYRTGNVNITAANIGLGNVNNTSDANKPVSTAQQTAIDSASASALSSAKTYADGLNTAMDTRMDAAESKLSGIADGANKTTVDSALSSSSTNPVQNKVINSALGGKVPTTRTVNGKALSSNISLTASDVGADASGSASSALASAKTYADEAAATVKNDLLNGAGTAYDTLKELGDLIDANVDAIDALETVASGKANASHTHGNITNAGAIGTAANKAVITTTNGVLTTGTVPVASGGTGATTAAKALTNLGLTATAAELNIMDGVTATTAELNYVDGVTSSIQSQLDAKQATITGGATTIASSNLTASRALVSDSSGKVAVSAVTSTELGYLDGVTSAIQTQLNAKAASSTLTSHTGNTSNPHSVTASQVGAYTKTEVDSALSGKAASSHTHTGLQAVTTSGTGAAYTATVSGITSLTKGVNFIMLPHTQSTTKTPTLNVNGLGAKTIQRYVSANDYSTEGYNESWLQTTRPVLVIYSGTYWYVQAMDKPAAYDLRGAVPVVSGGTGATDAATARANLGAAASDIITISSTEPTSSTCMIWIQTGGGQ